MPYIEALTNLLQKAEREHDQERAQVLRELLEIERGNK